MSIAPSSAARVAFRYRNFRLYQTARFLAIAAAEMQSVAVGWQVFEITHRPLDLGYVGLAQFLPGILLFLIAGQTADRISRKQIIGFCMAAFGFCSTLLLIFTLRGVNSVSPIYLILVMIGIVRAFNGPAGQAFLPLLVPEEHFPNAVSWGASIFMAATVIGPTLGGIVYGWTGGASAVYAAAIVCFVTSFILVLLIRLKPTQQRRRGISSSTVLAGFRYLWTHKILLGAISLDLFAVLLGGAVALLPVYAREILRVGSWGLGILRAAPGLGAVVVAIVMAHRPIRRRAGMTMLLCVAAFGVSTIVFGLSRSVPLSLLALVFVGATDMVSVIIRSTLVQLSTPDEMRGRVSAVNMLFVGASNEFGQFESGFTAHWFGTVPAVVIGGAGSVVIVALWSWLFPELRKVNRLSGVIQDVPAETALTADPNE